MFPASIVRSNTKFPITRRRGVLRRAGTMVSRSAVIRAVGTSEPRTNSIVGIRWRRSRPIGGPPVKIPSLGLQRVERGDQDQPRNRSMPGYIGGDRRADAEPDRND